MSTKSPESAPEPDVRPTCGLDGCEEPLPPRPRDELGRPKGGRRARYCSKAHADAASRQRRASDLAAVADPLALAREATAGVLPAARQLSEQLTSLMARFEQAENGALARVQAAETEAEQAHAEATRAAEAEQQAEQARREALAAARRDREEKDQALERARQAQAELQATRDETWKQIAEHERARGQVEAELQAARTALETLRREHAEVLQTTQDQHSRITQLDLHLATTSAELRQSTERAADLGARLDQAEQRHQQTAADWQSRHEQQTHQLATLQQAHDAAVAEARRLAQQLNEQLNTTSPTVRPAPVTRAPKPARRRPRVAGNRPAERPSLS
ncbi:hypothetical protein LWF15_28910 [Kineosporia rhizophila]|uniref:hypothetical protein n=1 Tax=Kineosporia TaxID=49184 RepID=UPI001E55A5D7|nr:MULTISPECIES: hypothetical protein [Kineosporia]MCE0539527.1 hypothetical protein [Kineosporia rhizophila]